MAAKQYKRRWVDGDGVIWAISKMDDRHLRNTIRMLVRWGNKAVEVALDGAFEADTMIVGEGAEIEIESLINNLIDTRGVDYAHENYKAFPRMVEVAIQRGLKILV